MNKKQIRLTESDLKQIVKESVNKILKESEGLNAMPYLNTNEFDRGFNPSQDKNDEINASWEAIDQEYGTPDIDFNDPYRSDANKLVYRDNGMTNGIYPLDDLSNPNVIDDDNYRSFWSYNDKISPKYFRKNESKNMNKRLIRLTESDLHRIVKESVNRILSEEVDTGQVTPAHERNMMHHTSPREEEIRKKIRKLRAMIGDYEDENKDTSELVKQLKRLKKEAGYC